MKQVIVTATKPQASVIEYGIRDSVTGAWLNHGLTVTIDVMALTTQQRNDVIASRNLLTASAAAQNKSLGRTESVTVVTTDPVDDICVYVEQGKDDEPPVQVSMKIADLSPANQAVLAAVKTLFASIATADATTRGLIP